MNYWLALIKMLGYQMNKKSIFIDLYLCIFVLGKTLIVHGNDLMHQRVFFFSGMQVVESMGSR